MNRHRRRVRLGMAIAGSALVLALLAGCGTEMGSETTASSIRTPTTTTTAPGPEATTTSTAASTTPIFTTLPAGAGTSPSS